MSEAEIKAKNAEDRKAYLKMLRELCPSKEIRQEAKRISKQKNSCDTCVFYDGGLGLCWYPYSDIYIEKLKIDHCYEGVLRYLVEETQDSDSEDFIDEEEAALINAPVCLQDMVYRKNKVINILTKYILEMVYQNKKLSKSMLNVIHNLYDATEEASPFFEQLLAENTKYN